MIRLFNSLTKSVQDFKPLDADKVTIYTCGPTVYDHITIGNLRAYITSDTLNRALALSEYKVKHVMNITDVDDKTINRSSNDFPEDSAEKALSKLTEIYEESFMTDFEAVGNAINNYSFVRASESIKIMQSLISDLLKSGFAYIADDGIYFSIDKYKKSGKKYGQLLELNSSNTSQARINNDEYDKNSIHDFALWKLMKPKEPSWSFIIDNKDYLGRPGWHIECSAMCSHNLGQPIDIHTGGVDLIFPHHENEIAQSTANKKDPIFAQFFIHNEHLMVNNRKMSKSLGNGYTLKDINEKGYDPLAYRLFILQSHYRSHADFSYELLDAAQTRLNGLRSLSALRWQASSSNNSKIKFDHASKNILDFLNDDLSTPKILAELSTLQTQCETTPLSDSDTTALTSLIELADKILGLELMSLKDLDKNTKNLLAEREDARKNKDWTKSDSIRAELLKNGVGINDTDFGQIWYLAKQTL